MEEANALHDASCHGKRSTLFASLALTFGLVTASTILKASPAIVPVTSCTELSLRTAVNSATSTSHIDMTSLPAGCTITLSSVIPIKQSSLYFYGPAVSPVVTISGNNQVQVFDHTGTGIVAFTQLAVIDGNATGSTPANGGCISSEGTVALVHSQVSGCAAISATDSAQGGGVYAATKVALNSSIVANNKAVSDNFGGSGGGVWTPSLTMNYSTVTGNSVGAQGNVITSGGGIYLKAGGSSLITNSTIDNNVATDGGGIAAYGDTTIINATISHNVATFTGGAITFYGGSSPTALTIANSTIAFNQSGFAAGLYFMQANVSINSSIMSNVRMDGSADNIYCDRPITLAGTDNLIGGATLKNCPAGLTYSSQDPQLTPLSNHGGLTRTHAILATSPAVVAGSFPAGYTLKYDQRGVGYPRIYSPSKFAFPDIGAYERQGATDDEIFYDGSGDQ